MLNLIQLKILKSIPLITGIYDFYINTLTENILMKDYSFFNVMNADEAFKEIESYVNYTCNVENTMVVLTEFA